MHSFNRAGWRGESYRHYLAAKGVKTKQPLFAKKYFATDVMDAPQSSQFGFQPAYEMQPATQMELSDMKKGNRTDTSNIQRLHAKGWKDDQILENAASLTGQGLLDTNDISILQMKASEKKSALPDAPETTLSGAPITNEFTTVDIPVQQPMFQPQPIMKNAPQVDLSHLEDELPSRMTSSPVVNQELNEESMQGTPKGLKMQKQIANMGLPEVATPSTPEVPDYDLKT